MSNSIPDLWDSCYEGSHKTTSPESFKSTFCGNCMNSGCRNSRGAGMTWVKRMQTQEDRLLHNPVFGDPDSPENRHLSGMNFKSMLREALAIQISSDKGDWAVPTEAEIGQEAAKLAQMVQPLAPAGFQPPEPDDVSPPEKLVDEVLITGLDGKGHRTPPEPAPEKVVQPPPFPEKEPIGSWKTIGDSGSVYLVQLFQGDVWTCECKGFKHSRTGTCKHVEGVSKRLSRAPEPLAPANPEPPTPEPPSPAPAPVEAPSAPPGRQAPTFAPKKGWNTGTPDGGIFVGGGPAPEAVDPWAPPAEPSDERVVPVGGKVQFKKK
jgi:hypothetical protein